MGERGRVTEEGLMGVGSLVGGCRSMGRTWGGLVGEWVSLVLVNGRVVRMAQARIYGFQWALVDGSRLFDLFDVVIVVMSIAFYILALTGTSLPPTPSFEASPLGPAHQSPRLVASEAGQPAATACLPFGCTFPPTHVRTHTQHGGFSHPSLLARAIAVDGWPGSRPGWWGWHGGHDWLAGWLAGLTDAGCVGARATLAWWVGGQG